MRRIMVSAVALLALSMAQPVFAKAKPWKDYFGVERSAAIPKKVRNFVIDAQACTHFSGEINGDNSARDRQVRKTVEKTCKDLDIRHGKLRMQYKGNAEVETILAEVWEPFL
jgi:hypothetical protein